MKANVDKNSKSYLAQQVNGGRGTLLAVVVLTLINLVLLVLNQDTYFLFSASVPYYLTFFGKLMDNGFEPWPWTVNGTYTISALVVAAVILILFLLCWLLSKKRSVWLTVGFVLFVVDTVALIAVSFLLFENPMENIMDLLIHIWAIWQLFQGVRCAAKLKALPEETMEAPVQSPEV